MTSSERKIINCLWETKEKTHIRQVAQKANLSSDYARLLCRSLARSGHIKFENDLAHLLKKGRGRFENSDPVADKPVAVAANVTLLTDEPSVVLPASPVRGREGSQRASASNGASDRSDAVQQSSPQEEENQEEGAGEDKDKDKSASSDEELDKALADLEHPSQKEEGEKIDEPEEPEKTESLGAATEPKKEAEKKEEAIELEPQATAESAEAKEEIRTEVQETGTTETKPADNPVPAATLESSEETAAIKKEERQDKEDAAKPSDGSGWSFKKIVNWFAEKK